MATAQQDPLKSIKLEALELEDLVTLKNRLSQDLQTYLNSYNGLKALEQRFNFSKTLIKNIHEKAEDNNEVMLPLTTSLYVPGVLKDKNRFMLELGTGYFVEYDAEGAQGFCQRKADFTKEAGEQAEKQMSEKREFIEKINIQISKKVQERQELILKQKAQEAKSQQKKN